MIRILPLALIALAGPAVAQDGMPSYDPAILTRCNAADHSGTTCIGRASDACMATPGGETTPGMRDCLGQETAQWDKALNDAYRQLTAEPGKRTDALRNAQRAWIAFVGAACTYEAGAYEGGSMADVASASCWMQQTARRALDLSGYVMDEAAR